MDSTHPYHEPEGRILAAILFTDAVSFSTRVRSEEGPTLIKIEDDFDVMKAICARYSGTVLKSTGDGLLMTFSSAVQAVRCALKIQRFFANRAKTNEVERPLVHRVGVHLGDVFAKDNDVMGDGVNIAARLQSAADPGGICISQTVYDVIKGKIDIDAERTTARDVKNASQLGPIYRLLLEPRKVVPVTAPVLTVEPPEPTFIAKYGKRLIAILAIVIVLHLARLLVVTQLENKANEAASDQSRAQIDAEMAKLDVNGPSGATTPPEFDYLAMAMNPSLASRLTPEQSAHSNTRAEETIGILRGWLESEMLKYTRSNSLAISGSRLVYMESKDRYVFAASATMARTPRSWDQLEPAEREQLIIAALRVAKPAPPPEVFVGAAAFAYRNRSPEMAAALKPNR